MRRLAFLAMSLLLLPAPAWAASCTTSATGVSFGTYIPSTASPTDNAGTVSVTCSAAAQTVNYSIALNQGLNASSGFNRRLKSGTSFLSYQIYTTAGRTTVWGNGTGGTSTVSDSYTCVLCTNVRRNYTTYGRLPALQWRAPGPYSDTITVTVTFN
ncbi:spore coat U domain-containing protein [Enhydrobacter sp.]|jgi:spore coat protein U-like protein|uniref:Csu type fimbrial protein n=1 Tax=Enhydrobacter sp. TaxID=1894999 RepID=UPI00261B40EC|nr:spore coat U domain-containing protein [Enhydrobacter sp.]WIM13209.1 MAG: hypothetical protein OJF58_004175 [Enhydrobacter sp.]